MQNKTVKRKIDPAMFSIDLISYRDFRSIRIFQDAVFTEEFRNSPNRVKSSAHSLQKFSISK